MTRWTDLSSDEQRQWHNRRQDRIKDLNHAKHKMTQACQNGSKRAWRKWGKKVYALEKELEMPIREWAENYFGRITK